MPIFKAFTSLTLIFLLVFSSPISYAQNFSSDSSSSSKTTSTKGSVGIKNKDLPADAAGMDAEMNFYNQSFDSAEKILLLLKSKKDKNFALWSSQLASLYLAEGKKDEAHKNLLDAFYLMNDISAFNQLEAKATGLTGDESAKAYKGDPYEKVFNAFYLSALLYDQKDLDNAYAATQSGLLADSGSEGSTYKADAAILYLLAARIEKERGNASMSDDYFKKADNAFRTTHLLNRDIISDVEILAHSKGDKEAEIEKLMSKYKESESPAVDSSNKNNFAAQPTKKEMSSSDKKKVDALNSEVQKLDADLADLRFKVEENNKKINVGALNSFVDLSNNVLLGVEIGASPLKFQIGQYGEKAVFAQKSYKIGKVILRVDGANEVGEDAVLDNDVRFQAITRGGRKMDGILKGKAEFKATTAQMANSLSQMSNQMTNQANQMAAANPYANTSGMAAAAGVMALFSLAMMIGSEMANPAADARHWSYLPARVELFPLKLSQGRHKIDVLAFDWAGKPLDLYATSFEVEVKDQKTNVFFTRIFERLVK